MSSKKNKECLKCKNSTVILQVKMEIFILIKKYLVEMGIDSHQSSQMHSFNAKNCTMIIMSILCMTTNIVYIIHDATFEEYVDVIYAFSTSAICFAVYNIMIWKKARIFETINGFEKLINNSE